MPVTVFNVVSNRICDIRLPEGKTVGELKRILQASGYDVCDARITVNRFQQKDKLVGKVDAYVLKDGDTVEFKTQEADIPNMLAEIDKACAACEAELSGERVAPSCKCKEEKRCKEPCHTDTDGVELNGLVVKVSKADDGIVLHISRA